MPAEAPTVDAILLRPEQAAEACGMSRSQFDKLAASGRIGPRPVEIGRLRLWVRAELEAWAVAGCPSRITWIARKNEQPRLAVG